MPNGTVRLGQAVRTVLIAAALIVAGFAFSPDVLAHGMHAPSSDTAAAGSSHPVAASLLNTPCLDENGPAGCGHAGHDGCRAGMAFCSCCAAAIVSQDFALLAAAFSAGSSSVSAPHAGVESVPDIPPPRPLG